VQADDEDEEQRAVTHYASFSWSVAPFCRSLISVTGEFDRATRVRQPVIASDADGFTKFMSAFSKICVQIRSDTKLEAF